MRPLGVDRFAAERGVCRVGGIALRRGDRFGLFRRERDVAAALHRVVYPRVRPVDCPEPRRRLPQGPGTDLLSPFEDALPPGIRPYRPGDQRRRIAWRPSARHDGLLLRKWPPVREAAGCLDLRLGA